MKLVGGGSVINGAYPVSFLFADAILASFGCLAGTKLCSTGFRPTATIPALIAQTDSTSTSFRPDQSPGGSSNVMLGL